MVIIGGGDTGADCLGTAHRQGAASVHQLEIMPEPPSDRAAEHPWPIWPIILRTSSAHEEGGQRLFSVTTTEFVDDGGGAVRALRGHQVEMTVDGGRPSFTPVEGSEFEMPCDLVLLAMGFAGSERRGVVADLGLELNPRGRVAADDRWSTNVDGVFVCGDMTRGQSPHRLGHRRGPVRRRRRRPLADGGHRPAGPDRPRSTGDALTPVGRPVTNRSPSRCAMLAA